MISEDYYGFSSHPYNTTVFTKQKSSYRTERSPRIGKLEPQSPRYKALKRTQLSTQKIRSKDLKKCQLPISPNLQRQQTLQQQMSSRAYKPAPSYHQSSYNKGQLQALTRKYDNYLKADSIEYVNDQISHHESEYTKSIRMRPQSRAPIPNRNGNRPYNQIQNNSYQQKPYHSASKGRNQQFLAHFQRDKKPLNPIDRANQTISSRTNNSRYKKSKSLTTEMKKQYKLHTFYHADRLKVLNYNEQGYLTQRQEEILLAIQNRARRAFQRAANEYENQNRSATKRPSRSKKFEIQQNSRMQHRNSYILSDLKQQSVNYKNVPPEISKGLSDRSQNYLTEEKVIDASINPKKSSHLHNDYQLNPGGRNGQEVISNFSISHFIQQKKGPIQNKNSFSNFAKESQDSLLQFKPSKPKKATKQNESKSNIKKEESNINKSLNNNSKRQPTEQNSQLSHKSIKSIDMMEINSNCKINQKKQLRSIQKIENNYIDDNRSLGIDTQKDFPNNQKSKVQHKGSQLSISNSQSLSRSHTISEVQSQSNSHQNSSRNSVSKSQFGSNKNFSKNKLKSSQSPSDYSSSLHTELIKPVEQKQKPKIKKVKKVAEKLLSEQSQSRHKIESVSALGSQSINKIDMMQPIQIKINPMAESKKQMSKIEQRYQKVASLQSSKFVQKSKVKEQSRMVQSGMKSKRMNSVNNSISNRSHSVVSRAKQRTSKYENQSNLQYDIFNQIRDFLEEQEYDYHQPRKQKQIPQQISDQLAQVLTFVEEHLYLLNCIVEIIIIVPDVYVFQTIYAKEKEWIFLPIFLTLKKYIYERGRVVTALSGGKNCFNLLGWTIQDSVLKKYTQRPQVKIILTNLIECNSKLELILANFQVFLKKFKKLSSNEAYINTKLFNNNDQLPILLCQYEKQIENLLKKREEQFNNGQIKENDQQFEMLTLVNQRIFRMTQVGFILSNLSGKQIKSYEKDEQLYRQQQKFKDYILQNHPLFKRMVKNFK